MQEIVDSLSPEAFSQLASAVFHRRKREAIEEAEDVTLTSEEMCLIENGEKIEAIKRVRHRLNISLMVAREAVDRITPALGLFERWRI